MGAPLVVGITGLARSGKDTAADTLVKKFGFVRVCFADALKEGSAAMLGLPLGRMYGGDRESPLPGYGFSIREFLQKMGTECVRQHFGHDFWIKAVRQRMASLAEQGYSRVVIPDVRFDNEAEFVRGFGGPVLRITRPGVKAMDHASEKGVASNLITDTIENDGSIGGFDYKVTQWAKKRGW